MSGRFLVERSRFDLLFKNTLDAIRENNFGRIFKDVVGARRGDRAVSVWATGCGDGLNELSIDTGYTVERNGVLRFSQGEGCLELAIAFEPKGAPFGIVELATKGGIDVSFEDTDAHVRRIARAFDLVLAGKLPPARLVPAPTVPFPLWASELSGHLGQSMIDPLELAALTT